MTYSALNTEITLNPLVGNEYFTPAEQTALVLIKVGWNNQVIGRREIILTGWGTGYTVQVNDIIHLRADQSCRDMGMFKVLGIVAGGVDYGQVPNGKRRHYVMK